MNRLTLKEWFIKHNVSAYLMSSEHAVKYAIIHEQEKFENKYIIT